MSEKILVVEDEELVGTMIRLNLENAGYRVVWIKEGTAAVRRAVEEPFDLILLDIALPGADGITVLDRIRKSGAGMPIMMLTARGDVDSKVGALELGADDYLPKPFDVAEIIARVQALVRRSRAERVIPSDHLLKIGKFEINLETRGAKTGQGEIVLSEKEAALVKLLIQSRGKVLTRSDILDEIWGMDATPTERTVDNFVVRLRKLFEPDPEKPIHILTIRGEGYRFVP